MSWTRVTRRNPCPICGKPDWCEFTPDGRRVLCMRVESILSTKNGGWMHLLDGRQDYVRERLYGDFEPQSGASITPRTADMIYDWSHHQNGEMEPFAATLGVSQASLWALGCLYAPEHRAFAFPMHNANRDVVGIRLRNDRGDKWAVKGSKQGLFLNLSGKGSTQPLPLADGVAQADRTASSCREAQGISAQNNLPVRVVASPDNATGRLKSGRCSGTESEARETPKHKVRPAGKQDSRGGQGMSQPTGATQNNPEGVRIRPFDSDTRRQADTLLIVEGPTDAAAAIDLGYNVIGRPACVGCEDMIAELARVSLGALFIVADNDGPGQRGARTLQQKIGRAKVITLPTKDLRKFLQLGGTKEILNDIMFAAV